METAKQPIRAKRKKKTISASIVYGPAVATKLVMGPDDRCLGRKGEFEPNQSMTYKDGTTRHWITFSKVLRLKLPPELNPTGLSEVQLLQLEKEFYVKRKQVLPCETVPSVDAQSLSV